MVKRFFPSKKESTESRVMEDVSLLPCPFCGGDPFFPFDKIKEHSWLVSCSKCGTTSGTSLNKKMAINAWNHRGVWLNPLVNNPAPGELVEVVTYAKFYYSFLGKPKFKLRSPRKIRAYRHLCKWEKID